MIYLDNAAGTRIFPEVINIMTDVMKNNWGNPSADYSFGYESRAIVEGVRKQIAEDINCEPEEIIFTSGACEANSLAIQGILFGEDIFPFWTTKLEHASIYKIPVSITHLIDNDSYGYITCYDFANNFASAYKNSNQRALVSICASNGEIGTIQDIDILSDITHKYNGIFHTDATQLFPEQRINVQEDGIDLMSVSAQKFHGPRGIGFLYVKKGLNIEPIIYGSQENGLRAGTYNVAAIAGMGKALERTRQKNCTEYIKCLRDKLVEKLLEIPGTHLNGCNCNSPFRLVNNISLTIDGVNAEDVVTLCDERGIIIAKGSACQSYAPTPSKTLLAIGLTEKQALSTVRITLDEFNTMEEINKAAKEIKEVIEILRKY